MNQLSTSKRAQIINLLVEGNSMRATSRITETSINTVTKLLVGVGRACETFHNEMVMKLASKRIQADEIRAYVYAKPKNVPKGMEDVAGEIWTWTAIDADSRLIVSWLVGDRGKESALAFMNDLRKRVTTPRFQLSTDGYSLYRNVVDEVFGIDLDFAQIVKIYGSEPGPTSHAVSYGTEECIGTERTVVSGSPNPEHVSTSYAERQNLTMRMHMRRFTRLTNGFSKKVENHWLAIALHFVYYNFVKVHKTLRVTPAMEAGLTKKPMTIEELVLLTA